MRAGCDEEAAPDEEDDDEVIVELNDADLRTPDGFGLVLVAVCGRISACCWQYVLWMQVVYCG